MLEGNQQALLQMMRDTKIAVNDIITIQQERDRKQREQDEQVGVRIMTLVIILV